jgi:hypothetical protein
MKNSSSPIYLDAAMEEHIELMYQLKPNPEDQVLFDVEMPLRARLFPFGFPIEITTNSEEILKAASESWKNFQQRFDTPPLKLKLGVTADPTDSRALPPAPLCRVQGDTMLHIADQYNFVSCDLRQGIAFGWVTEETTKSHLYLRYFLLEAAIYCMMATTRVVVLHAACITSNGYGMLLCGDSGAGKSSLAFAGARSGWTFTCDDASYLLMGRKDNMVVGNCHQFRLRDSGPQLFPELEGRSITPRAAGKPSIEIPTIELDGINTSVSATVQAIVFLNRRNVTKSELVPSSKTAARRWADPSNYTKAIAPAEHGTAVDNLFNLPVYELRYTELDWAIDRLNQLATQGS